LSRTSQARLALYDSFGKEIAVIFDGIATSGLNTFSFKTSEHNIANGAYFYTLITNEFKESKSLIIMR